MNREQIIEKVAEFITNAPKNAKRFQIISLGDGGWIEAETYDQTEEDK